MKKRNKTGAVIAVLLALTAVMTIVCLKFIAPVCSGLMELASGKQAPMKCSYASAAAMFLAVVSIVNAVSALFTRQHFQCGLVSVVTGIFMILVFSNAGIGICVNTEMACHVTAPLVKTCAAVQIILGAILAVCNVSALKHEK